MGQVAKATCPVMGLTGQDCFAVLGQGLCELRRGRGRVTQKRAVQCENRLQASEPVCQVRGFRREAGPHLISMGGDPAQQITTRPCHLVQKSHRPRSAQNAHPARAEEGTLSVWAFWSLTWKPMQFPETGATVWAKVAAVSGDDSPLGPKEATCVVSGAFTKSARYHAGAP